MDRKKMLFGPLLSTCCAVVGLVFAHSSTKDGEKRDGKAQGVSSLTRALQNAASIAVFRVESRQRKYLGNISRDRAAFKELLSALREGRAAEKRSSFRPRLELVLLGIGSYWLAQYDPDERLLVAESVTNKRRELRGALRTTKRIETFLLTAKPLSNSVKQFKPAHTAHPSWSALPWNLVELVKRSSVILVGTPITILRNDYLAPNQPRAQVIVYEIEVDIYLKDDTKLYLPIIKHYQFGGYLGGGFAVEGDPLLKFGQQYLLFLQPPRGEFAYAGAGRVRDCYPDEYIAVHEFTRTPIVGGRTEPAESDFVSAYWFSDGKTRLIYKKEKQVIEEILAALRESEGE